MGRRYREDLHHHVELTGLDGQLARWTAGPAAKARLIRKKLVAEGHQLARITVYPCVGKSYNCPLSGQELSPTSEPVASSTRK